MISTELRAKAISNPGEPCLRHMAAMFVDLDHFMRICIEDPPEAVFGLLGDFQLLVTHLVSSFRGELNSYQGDGVLATFGDLAGRSDCATRALRCARRILEQIPTLNLDRSDVEPVTVSIGLQYGPMWTSTIKTSSRFGPTLIGDAVNVAARLEQQAGALGAQILAGDELIERAARESASNTSDLAQFVNAGPLLVRGRQTPVVAWKLQVQPSDFLLDNTPALFGTPVAAALSEAQL